MKKLLTGFVCIMLILVLTGCNKSTSEESNKEEVKYMTGKHNVQIEVENYGTINVELDADTAPISVTNFINLANQGFYNGLTFHRIIKGFMIQGGDPEGTGNGGSPNKIKGEFKRIYLLNSP